MRIKFDEQLDMLNKEMITMGALCENAIAISSDALEVCNSKDTEQVIDISMQIERKEREIENLCMKLLLQQQPVAKDLRVISSALKMITDMERIGHQSADIAEIVREAQISSEQDRFHIREMAQSVIKMVTDSVDAFVNKDEELARKIIKYDDIVDDYFNSIKKSLISTLTKGDTDGEYVLDFLMIAKYLERIGDHAVNIADWVLFSITGKRIGD